MGQANDAIEYVLGNEGGIVDHPHDKGSITNGGISLRFLKSISAERLKSYGIFDEIIDEDTIRNLTLEQKKAIYRGEFWDYAPFGKINNQAFCNYVFDMAVNMGIAPAIKCVQRACWAIKREWKTLLDDGILGDNTINIINDSSFIFVPTRSERGSYYRNIVNNDPSQREFLDGWYNRTYTL